MAEHKRNLQKFDRFNEDFVAAYMSERALKKGLEKNKLMSPAG